MIAVSHQTAYPRRITQTYSALPWPTEVQPPPVLKFLGGTLRTTTNISRWAAANGLAPEAIVDLGQLAPAALAVVLREADVALFPNRAECDSNPMLLECMASGVPVIASRNTGQRDVATAELCYPLVLQSALRGMPVDGGTEGWGESSVDEIVAQLEMVFAQTSAARKKAAVAAEWAKGFGWEVHAPRLIELLAPMIRRVKVS